MKKTLLIILRFASVATLSVAIFIIVTGYQMTSNEAEAQCVAIQSQTYTKICSCVNAGSFRDSLLVPDGWTATTCTNWCSYVGGAPEHPCMSPTGIIVNPACW